MFHHLIDSAREKYLLWYGREPVTGAYAPGRVEVLGNHTDYNEGFVLSAAIDFGMVFLAAGNPTDTCRVVAGDLMRERDFPIDNPAPFTDHSWPNYVMGVTQGLAKEGALNSAFDGLFFGNIPIGAGLSSSAALSMSTGLALSALSGKTLPPVEMAKIGQHAEHAYVGAKTGLMDQLTSLSGREGHLVHTDFRTLEVTTVPFDGDYVLLTCDTRTKHSLGDSDYNERREACEEATAFFASHLHHPVSTLRDVSSEDLRTHAAGLPGNSARRAAHIIGENERVIRGAQLLATGDMNGFGELMYASHESSRINFENSCEELDFLVDTSREIGSVTGARLSGGGFGGSAVMLLRPENVSEVVEVLQTRYRHEFGSEFVPHTIHVSDGARTLTAEEVSNRS